MRHELIDPGNFPRHGVFLRLVGDYFLVQFVELERAFGPVFFRTLAGVLQPGEFPTSGRSFGRGWDLGGCCG